MQGASGVVSLLSDFGLSDPFVGVMKGVLFAAHPGLRVIDLSHGIAPGAIMAGAFWLERSYPYFPPGSVHCAVVDPGVGSSRAAVVVSASGHYFVGPDNGLLAEVARRSTLAEVRAIDLERHGFKAASATFHGRDIFAVMAGRLAAQQLPFGEVGPTAALAVPSPIPEVVCDRGCYVGCVLTSDHFGNLITSLRAAEVLPQRDAPFRVAVAGQRLRSVRTFADAEPGELVALVGSFDAVEIVVRDGSARGRLSLPPGSPVTLEPS